MNSDLKDLLEQTSLPGLSLFIRSKQLVVKIAWLLFTLLFLSVSIYFVIESIQNYYDYEVVTNIHVVRERIAPFPAISFCVSLNNSIYEPINTSLHDILYSCDFEGDPCQSSDFEVYQSKMSTTCFRYNTGKNALKQYTKIRNSKRDGLDSGLTVLFNTSKLDFFDTYESKIKISVNNASAMFWPYRKFNVYQENTNFLIKGTNSIRIERILNKKLPEPHNHCKNIDTTNLNTTGFLQIYFNSTYLQRDCLDLCIDHAIQKECNANKSCSQIKTYNYRSQKDAIPFECSEKCPEECEFMEYKTYVSYLGPVNAKYKILNSATALYPIPERIREDLVHVNVYYAKLEYTFIYEIAKMSIFDLISSIGGILGLFIGFSFFSLIEIAHIILEFMSNQIYKKLNESTVSIKEISLTLNQD